MLINLCCLSSQRRPYLLKIWQINLTILTTACPHSGLCWGFGPPPGWSHLWRRCSQQWRTGRPRWEQARPLTRWSVRCESRSWLHSTRSPLCTPSRKATDAHIGNNVKLRGKNMAISNYKFLYEFIRCFVIYVFLTTNCQTFLALLQHRKTELNISLIFFWFYSANSSHHT